MLKIVLVETAKIVPSGKPRGQAPMGLMLIADALNKNGCEVKIIDAFIESPYSSREVKIKSGSVYEYGLDNKSLLTLIFNENPNIIGLTYMLTIEHGIKNDLVQEIRAKNKTIPIIMGGVAASSAAGGILGFGSKFEKIDGVDIVVTGRGVGLAEETTINLVKLLSKRDEMEKSDYFSQLSQIKGIAYKDETGKLKQTPYPDLDLSNYDFSYNRSFLKTEKDNDLYSLLNNPHAGPTPYPPAAEISTSNGCPFQCNFCHIKNMQDLMKNSNKETTKFWDRLPMKKIFEEISKIRGEGYNTISFEDDNFFGFTSDHIQGGIDILDFCAQKEFKCIQFPNGVTISSLLKDNCKALHFLGWLAKKGILVRFAIAIESGSDNTLQRFIKKPHSKAMVIKLLETINTSGYFELPKFETEAFFVFGNMDENGNLEPLENIQESREFLFNVSAKYKLPVSVFGCVPNPPGIHYFKFLQYQEKHNGSVNWPEMLFTQVTELDGKESYVEELNKIISKTKRELKEKKLLHFRTATVEQ